MDRERARFLLASFRPDGADAEDGDFAAALRLALADRELGEWLAAERAFDSQFAAALASLPLPADLREAVVLGMQADAGGIPQAGTGLDAQLVGALASVAPPPGMRASVLAAMHASAAQAEVPVLVGPRRWWMPAAAAALVMLGAWLALQSPVGTPGAPGGLAGGRLAQVSADKITLASIQTLEAPGASMEVQTAEPREVDAWLALRELPAPLVLPSGLREVPCLGCRTIVVDGYRGSMVCYDSDSGPVHLVVFDRPCVAGSIPAVPEVTQEDGWTVAKWCDGKRAYILLSRAQPEAVSRLFCAN